MNEFLNGRDYSVGSAQVVDKAVFDEINTFFDSMKNEFLNGSPLQSDYLDFRLRFAQVKKENENSDESFVVFARDSNQRVLGFSFCVVKNGTVKSLFFGVKPTFKGFGIATEIVKVVHESLKERGIDRYEVSVWDASKRVLEKLATVSVIQKTERQEWVSVIL